MLTTVALQSLPRDLRLDESGTIRVGRSRVTFDLVIEEYRDGATPEDIVARYPAVELPEVYSAITWYLHEGQAAEEYLAARTTRMEANRGEIERRFPAAELRKRLLMRWKARERKTIGAV
jgi:uncharacterized protein (DUF433 family)